MNNKKKRSRIARILYRTNVKQVDCTNTKIHRRITRKFLVEFPCKLPSIRQALIYTQKMAEPRLRRCYCNWTAQQSSTSIRLSNGAKQERSRFLRMGCEKHTHAAAFI